MTCAHVAITRRDGPMDIGLYLGRAMAGFGRVILDGCLNGQVQRALILFTAYVHGNAALGEILVHLQQYWSSKVQDGVSLV